jgi:hypothetical protein
MKKNSRTCAICGIETKTTKDHIPPKCLYPTPRDNGINLNTVPACNKCNNGSASDDEIFKVIIGIDTGEHQKEPEKVAQSLKKTIDGSKDINTNVLNSSCLTYANLNGKVLEPAVAVTFDFSSYERVINRIVRGLYWMETRKSMPSEAIVTVIDGKQIAPSFSAELMEVMHLLPLKKLNQGTFAYRWHAPPEKTQIWGLQFFDRHTVFAVVSLPNSTTDPVQQAV